MANFRSWHGLQKYFYDENFQIYGNLVSDYTVYYIILVN